MPRTIAVESPGCPPLKALTTDVLGLVKVVESRGKAGALKVVETWGAPDASRAVLATSYVDRESKPLLAVALKNGLVEFLNPLNGDALAATNVGESYSSSSTLEDDFIAGLHVIETKRIDLSSELILFLMCSSKGKACLRSIAIGDALADSTPIDSPSTWDVCSSGKVICSSVDANGNYALFGGKGIEVNVWDLEKYSKIWAAKPPPCNSLQIFSPTWFTAATFLSKDDHRKIVAGTNNHQVRLYDISAQRRPVISVSFRESPIKVVTEDPDGHTIYIGTGCGDIASFDMRTGNLLGCFVGKCSGSVRSIARHPELPLIASCGLDRYLRVWDTKTRQLLSAVFLKQHLTSVVIDSHFSTEVNSADQSSDLQVMDHTEVEEDDEEQLPSKVRRMPQKKDQSKIKTQKSKKVQDVDQTSEAHSSISEVENDYDQAVPKQRKRSEEREQSRRIKQKKSKKNH